MSLTVEAALKGDTNNKKITGLMQVLNAQQERFLKVDQIISIKDEYEIEFGSPEIATAAVVDTEFYNKVKAGTVAIDSLAKVNVKTAESADARVVEKGIREISLTSGMSIIHAIDQVITQSKYITDAMISNDKEMIAPVNKDDKQYSPNFNDGDAFEFIKKNAKSIVIKCTNKVHMTFSNGKRSQNIEENPGWTFRVETESLYQNLIREEDFKKSFNKYVMRKEALELLGI